MTAIDLPLDDLQLDRSPQVRATVNEGIVGEYAERMREGDVFPPLAVFHDGLGYYLADGGHRVLAAKRIGRTTFAAQVTPGGERDALWYALKANSTNGHRLTPADTRHAVLVALQAFPDKSAAILAAQIGCTKQYVADIRNEVTSALHLPDRVTGVDGRSYAATSEQKRAAREKAVLMIREGCDAKTVQAETGLGRDALNAARREAGAIFDKSRAGVEARHTTMRAMAAEGHTSIQIAAAVGMSIDGCRLTLKRLGIPVHADTLTRNLKRHNSNRIVDSIVMDAANLTEGLALIDFASLDRTMVPEWLRSLMASRDKLGGLIRRLMKEQQHDDQVA